MEYYWTISGLVNELKYCKNFDERLDELGKDLIREIGSELIIDNINNVKRVKKIIEYGIDVNQCDRRKHTPLHHAKYAKVVKLLLEAGADAKVVDDNNNTVLHTEKSAAAIARLLKMDIDPNSKNKSGYTPLMFARDAESVALLLSQGANPNIPNNLSDTPLHNAENEDVVRLLLEYGADPNAMLKNYPLLSCFTDDNEIVCAILLLMHGADPNAFWGDMPLIVYALDFGEYNEFVITLLEYGANPNLRDFSNGRCALHYAKSANVVEALLEKGAYPDIQDSYGNTPLHLAWEKENRKEIIQLLLEHGANPNITNNDKESLLSMIDTQDDESQEIVNLLLQYGADSNIRNGRGQLPWCNPRREEEDEEAYLKEDYTFTRSELEDYYGGSDWEEWSEY